VPPFHALANVAIGVVLFFWVIAPALHFSGWSYAEYLPFFNNKSWDNTQHHYNITRILNPDYTFNLKEYEAYSPLFLGTAFALCYGLSFAAIISVIVNTAIFSSSDIWARFREREGELPFLNTLPLPYSATWIIGWTETSQGALDDIHMKMMRKYVQVPWWWFATLFVVFAALSFVTCYAWPTGLDWWALIIALLISTVWLVPIAMIQAVTNIQIGLNVFTEFLIGYMLPGRPNAMMMFKTVCDFESSFPTLGLR
jgi:OPT family oligopeptide transporter